MPSKGGVQILLQFEEAKLLRTWVLERLSKGFLEQTLDIPRIFQLYQGPKNVAERQGDSTAQQENAGIIENASLTDSAFSADSAISAVFSQILEQILEQE